MPENTQETTQAMPQAEVAQPVQPVQPAQPIQPAPQKSKKTLWWILGGCGCLALICAAVFAGIFGLGYFTIKESQKPADEFFKLVKDGKADQAYDSTSKEFKENTTKSQWSDFVKQYELDKNDGVDWTGTEKETSRTKLQGKMKLPSGEKTIRLDLVKEGDDWKVFGLRLE